MRPSPSSGLRLVAARLGAANSEAQRATLLLSAIATGTAATFTVVLALVTTLAPRDWAIVLSCTFGSAVATLLAARGHLRASVGVAMGTLWVCAAVTLVIYGLGATAMPALTIATMLIALWGGTRLGLLLIGLSATLIVAVSGLVPIPLPTPDLISTHANVVVVLAQFAFLAALVVFFAGLLDRLRAAFVAFDERLTETTLELEASRSAQFDSEARYAELMQALPDAVLVIEPDGRIAQANRALERILGLPASSFEGQRLGEIGLFPPAERTRVYDAIRRTLGGESVEPLTLAIRHADGTARWIEASARLITNSDGAKRILTLVRDTTERRRGEQSRRMLAQAIAGAHNAMTLADLEGNLTYVNAAFLRMWGYDTADECEGQSSTAFWADPAAAAVVLSRLRTGETDVTGTLVARRRDGSTFDVELAASVIEGDDGSAIGFMGSFTDITARLAAEHALREREAQLLRAKHIAILGGWELDVPSQTLTWDDEVKRIHEVGSDYVPQLASAIDFYTPESRPVITAAVERLLQDGEPFLLELPIRSATGRQVWARAQGEAEWRDGKVVKAFGIFQDLTELHEATERLRAAEEHLIETQRLESLGRLAGGIAHDFNNLLTAILGYADELSHALPTESQAAEDVGEIRRAGLRARELTAQLLAFARRQVVLPQTIDVGTQLQVLQRFLTRLVGEDVSIDLVAPTDTTFVRIDPTQFEQVVVNLAANARDAMAEGGRFSLHVQTVTLDAETAAARGLQPGPHVHIDASDEGAGMPEEVAARIFEPFFTTKEMGKGIGLGLATVYGIVRQAGGDIAVESEVGRGTTFRILLPSVPAADTRPDRRSDPSAIVGGRERVLYVEDEAVVRGLGERLLRNAGYEVIVAADAFAAEAAVAAPDARIDLLVTDVVMPRRSGTELADRLVARWPSLPVLFVSGYNEERLADRHRNGRSAYLPKPYQASAFLEEIRRLLDGAH